MGSTNTTTYYNLSQFISTDKPAWLQDYNGDMLKIDTGINAAKVAADSAALAAGTAQSTADGAVNAVSTLSSTVSTHTSQITSLSGAINTINSLIGNGTPTTTDQTIIGAINEINGDIKQHDFGSEIDILTAATSGGYTALSDGYLKLQNEISPSGSYASGSINDVEIICVYNDSFLSYSAQSIFVRAGMVIKLDNHNMNLRLKFIPLT